MQQFTKRLLVGRAEQPRDGPRDVTVQSVSLKANRCLHAWCFGLGARPPKDGHWHSHQQIQKLELRQINCLASAMYCRARHLKQRSWQRFLRWSLASSAKRANCQTRFLQRQSRMQNCLKWPAGGCPPTSTSHVVQLSPSQKITTHAISRYLTLSHAISRYLLHMYVHMHACTPQALQQPATGALNALAAWP